MKPPESPNGDLSEWLASLADWEPTPEAVAACQRIADILARAHR
jgi:hypothetical protein